jgi:NADH-quinone oxidoreductase subunit J
MEAHITWSFGLLAGLTLLGGVAAVTLRNLIHCALALAVSFAGLAGIYLQLNAQFVGFAQILVYVGAVAILIVFAILLTRGADTHATAVFSRSWVSGLLTAVLVFGVASTAILSSKLLPNSSPAAKPMPVRVIGEELMTKYILPLEVLGLLLTAALIGAVILALHERSSE